MKLTFSETFNVARHFTRRHIERGLGDKALARWRDHGGRQVSATFERKKDAVAAREQARAEVRRVRAGQLAPPPDAAHSFDSLCDHWLSVKAGKRSIKDDQSMIRKYLQPALGRLELTSITKFASTTRSFR